MRVNRLDILGFLILLLFIIAISATFALASVDGSPLLRFVPETDNAPSMVEEIDTQPVLINTNSSLNDDINTATAPIAADTEWESILQTVEQDNHAAALQALDTLLISDDTHTQAYTLRGELQAKGGDFEAALADFDTANLLAPEDAAVFYQRGLLYSNHNNPMAAVQDFTNALYYADDAPVSYRYQRGLVYLQIDEIYPAILDFNGVLRDNPQHAEAQYWRGRAYLLNTEPKKALADFDAILLQNSDFIEALYWRGNAHFMLENYPDAIIDYSEVLRLTPAALDTRYRRALAYTANDDIHAAIDDYSSIIQQSPRFIDAYLQRGALHLIIKDYENALHDYQAALSLNEQTIAAWRGSGLAYEGLSADEQAMDSYQRYLTLATDTDTDISDRLIALENRS